MIKKLNKKNKKAQGFSLEQPVVLIGVIIVIILVLALLFRTEILSYLRKLPSYGSGEGETEDAIIGDEIVERKDKFEVKINWVSLEPEGKDEVKIEFKGIKDNQCQSIYYRLIQDSIVPATNELVLKEEVIKNINSEDDAIIRVVPGVAKYCMFSYLVEASCTNEEGRLIVDKSNIISTNSDIVPEHVSVTYEVNFNDFSKSEQRTILGAETCGSCGGTNLDLNKCDEEECIAIGKVLGKNCVLKTKGINQCVEK
ncbi:MAG: hypothetical protein ACE5ES_03810 [Candidatus Nanoarchaeia archaeon]